MSEVVNQDAERRAPVMGACVHVCERLDVRAFAAHIRTTMRSPRLSQGRKRINPVRARAATLRVFAETQTYRTAK